MPAVAQHANGSIDRTDLSAQLRSPKGGRELEVPIDYMRDNRTNTAVSPFHRARPGALVSMPREWKELSGGPERWTLLTVP